MWIGDSGRPRPHSSQLQESLKDSGLIIDKSRSWSTTDPSVNSELNIATSAATIY